MFNVLVNKRLSILLALVMIVLLFSSCFGGGNEATVDSDSNDKSTAIDNKIEETNKDTEDTDISVDPVVIRWGWHNMREVDPYYVDEATGEYTMVEVSRQAALAALEKVKEELNVEVEFVEYTQDVRSELITSVLANDPVCDIAGIWGGAESTILAQNILQPLDDYAHLFEDEEYSWMWYDKIYGHNYFLTWMQTFLQRWPLLFNITMIEEVDLLKDENGETIYPMDLFLEGKWNWSTFKDFLSKIQTYYANASAPDGCTHDTIQPYETDYRFAALSAVYSAGGAVYDPNGLQVDAPETLKAVSYITDLYNSGLMTDPGTYSDGFVPVWTKGGQDFQNGGTVFTDCPDWWIVGSASAAAERGEAIGIVPWPRPDDIDFNDENYRQVVTVGNSVAILKGVSSEKTELALKFWRLYWKTYYEVYGGVDNIINYKQKTATTQAAAYGFDIFNEKYGDSLLECFQYLADECVGNDYADLIGVKDAWFVILGKGLYGIDGMPAYEVAIEANKNEFDQIIEEIGAILASGEIRDNIAPSIMLNETIALPKGTDLSIFDWSSYFTIEDAVEGILDATTAVYDVSAIDFNTVGIYDGGLKVIIQDKSGNGASGSYKVTIYNPDNTTAPTITIKEEYRTINLDEDASAINWAADFVKSAVDADGLDVSGNITADLSDLDTTIPGEYDVLLTVKDYAGNESSVTIKVEVKIAE